MRRHRRRGRRNAHDPAVFPHEPSNLRSGVSLRRAAVYHVGSSGSSSRGLRSRNDPERRVALEMLRVGLGREKRTPWPRMGRKRPWRGAPGGRPLARHPARHPGADPHLLTIPPEDGTGQSSPFSGRLVTRLYEQEQARPLRSAPLGFYCPGLLVVVGALLSWAAPLAR